MNKPEFYPTQGFSGGVFSQTIEGGRAGASIELDGGGVMATISAGDVFRLSFSECQIEMGGASGRMVFCRNADRSLTIFCEDKKFPNALREKSGGLLAQQLTDSAATNKRIQRSGRRFVNSLILASLLLMVALYFGVRWAGHAAVMAAPVAIDKEIGEQVFPVMDMGGQEIVNPEIVEPLQEIVDRLAPHAALKGLDFEIHVIENNAVNAFALPGGKMVVFTGLLEKATRPEQVAGVLGHEMSHATLRHGLKRIGQAMGLAAVVNLLLGDVQAIVVAGGKLFQMATVNSYSRTQESEADAEGVRMLHAAGIDPMGMMEFFQTLHEEHAELPGALSWISTHPEHHERAAAVKALLAELPEKKFQPLNLDWNDYQNKLALELD